MRPSSTRSTVSTASTRTPMRRRTFPPSRMAFSMATATPARVIGLADRKGSLAPGFDADIVLMDKQLNVKAVMARGQFVE